MSDQLSRSMRPEFVLESRSDNGIVGRAEALNARSAVSRVEVNMFGKNDWDK